MNEPAAILERSLRRDAAIRAAGNVPGPAAESHIIDFIVKHELFESDNARRWLIERSSVRDYWVTKGIVESIGPLVERGYAADAVALFAVLVDLDDESGSPQRRNDMLRRESWLRHELEKQLEKPGLISEHPTTWGSCLIRFQSLLLLEEQHSEAGGNEQVFAEPRTRQADSDHHFHYWFYQTKRPERDAWGMVAKVVEQGLAEAVALAASEPFSLLAQELIASKWGLAMCQPLVALYDHSKEMVERSWQREEAKRLLCLNEVEQSYAAFAWRRLLRRNLFVNLTKEEKCELLQPIRQYQENVRVRVNELSDFQECGLLTREEETAIDKARRDGELFAPTDPRDLRSASGASFSSESPTDRFIDTWPHPDDHALLKSLTATEALGKDVEICDLEASLFPRLDALNVILTRSEVDSPDWFGEILGWGKRAIEDLKRWSQMEQAADEETPFDTELYLEALERKAPWWGHRVAAALARLKQPAPDDHASHQSDHISWGSNDPVACSLSFLDEVLAAPTGSKLDVYRSDLEESVANAWDCWPTYTRGLSVAILRTYYWSNSPCLTELLVRVLQTETHSDDIEFALHHLLRAGSSGIAQLMRSLLERVDTLTNPSDIAYMIGGVIGNAVVRYRGSGEDAKELEEISRWYDQLAEDCPTEESVRFSLIASILEGAKSFLGTVKLLEDRHAEVWLALITWGLNTWLNQEEGQKNHLPVRPVTDVREMHWNVSQRAFLLEGIVDVLLRLVSEADLGGFYEVHYELRKLLEDDTSKRSEVVACPLSDKTLLRCCRASAERVAQWWREGKTTNDLAYRFSLSGDNTSELLTLVFNIANDRENARREIAPIIDILADAGLRDTASQLRNKFRHS